ncbi:MAG: MATE family efflux transporter [Gammaproteobacteria bacterium]|nr:MATE family efflux transporter [Gammaproteobacteria bacterium]
MLANASVPLVGVIDTAVMGQMPNAAYIGAVAIGATIFSSLFWLFGFLRMGTGGLVAQAHGRRDQHAIQQTVYQGLLISLIIGVVILALQIPLFALSQLAFTTSPELLGLTRDYYTVRILAAPAVLVIYVILGALIGLQKMKAVMLIQLFLNLLNVALTLLFFLYFDWGIKGVALATVVSELLTVILGLKLLRSHIPISLKTLNIESVFVASEWRRLFEVNRDLFIRTLCLIAAFYWLTAASSTLGETALAANALLIQMLHFMAHALDGFAHTAESLGGEAYGQRNRQKFIQYTRASTELGASFAILFTLLYFVAGPYFLNLMTTLPDVISYTQTYLPWIVIAPLISVWSFLLDGIFIGVTHTHVMRNGMLVSLALFVAASLLLLPAFGNHGLWAAYSVLMIARAASLVVGLPGILSKLH